MMYKKGKDYFSSFVSGLVSSFLRPNKPFFSAGLFSEDSVAACCTRSRGVSTELIAQRFKRSLWRSVPVSIIMVSLSSFTATIRPTIPPMVVGRKISAQEMIYQSFRY